VRAVFASFAGHAGPTSPADDLLVLVRRTRDLVGGHRRVGRRRPRTAALLYRPANDGDANRHC